MARGRLIVFEGAEGVGKSTQLRRLASWLESGGRVVHAHREPGGTPLGDEIRRVLLDPQSDIAARAEALLFMASRAQLVERLVRPALAAGHVVLLDRFFLSTYAYQGAGRGLPEAEVRQANAVATDGLVPDLTLLMTLPVAEGLARATRRGERDRMERNADDFHHRVAQAFASFADPGWQRGHPECGPIVTVDASGSEDEVFGRVRSLVEERLQLA
jgi:dTMP kinase